MESAASSSCCSLGLCCMHAAGMPFASPIHALTATHPLLRCSVRPERESQTIFLSCVGAGVKNLSKRVQ